MIFLLLATFFSSKAFGSKKDVSSENCKKCHSLIYKEWFESPHKTAFTSKEFKHETDDYKIGFCMPCHIPKGFMGSPEKLAARKNYKEEGVGCPGCHMVGDRLQSRHAAPSKAHPKRSHNVFFGKSMACYPCHKTNYKEISKFKAKKPKTCQECHMKKIKRTGEKLEEYQLESQDHSFSVFKRKTYDKIISMKITKLERTEKGVQASVEIENLGAYHSIPSSDFGYNELVVTVELKNEMALAVSQKYFSLLVETKNVLPPKEKKTYSINLEDNSHEGVRLHARLLKVSFDRKDKILLLETDGNL